MSEGDEVQVGTPLFTYDTKDLAAKKESATLELESLNNTLSGYDAQIEQLNKEKKEASKDQQLDYTLQIQQVQNTAEADTVRCCHEEGRDRKVR